MKQENLDIENKLEKKKNHRNKIEEESLKK